MEILAVVGLTWMETEVVVDESVWVAMLTRDARVDSQRSLSSSIPASWYSFERSLMSSNVVRCCWSWMARSRSFANAK